MQWVKLHVKHSKRNMGCLCLLRLMFDSEHRNIPLLISPSQYHKWRLIGSKSFREIRPQGDNSIWEHHRFLRNTETALNFRINQMPNTFYFTHGMDWAVGRGNRDVIKWHQWYHAVWSSSTWFIKSKSLYFITLDFFYYRSIKPVSFSCFCFIFFEFISAQNLAYIWIRVAFCFKFTLAQKIA